MPAIDLLTADEAANLLRISRRTSDNHVARGDIAYIAVGLGLKRVRRRFSPEDLVRFRDSQRRVDWPSEITTGRSRISMSAKYEAIDFKALLKERRAARRVSRKSECEEG
ncbi:hypothetical protein AO398_10055 [Methylobacterium sp. GXS13]|uniref:helix-turn-helix domain-containing protein n=1 Tax=Methylobacterium sp. GXS13 TaxID=1730094 RepID=UPI00071BBC30|nr:helix-turn-helix domain-containing protein [Methylobacterium sp. GXS13]KST56613.1 hypothetical protein AO398_10055 [Methylobacterium sp. GXS13]